MRESGNLPTAAALIVGFTVSLIPLAIGSIALFDVFGIRRRVVHPGRTFEEFCREARGARFIVYIVGGIMLIGGALGTAGVLLSAIIAAFGK